MGADHTTGATARAQVDNLKPAGQVELSRKVQLMVGIFDYLGLCMFVSVALAARLDILAELINARYGWNWDVPRLQELSKQTIITERQFKWLAGFGPMDDRLPEFFYSEPSSDTGSAFDVPQEEVETCYVFE